MVNYKNLYKLMEQYNVDLIIKPKIECFSVKYDSYSIDIPLISTDKEIEKRLSRFFRKIKLIKIREK